MYNMMIIKIMSLIMLIGRFIGIQVTFFLFFREVNVCTLAYKCIRVPMIESIRQVLKHICQFGASSIRLAWLTCFGKQPLAWIW